MARIRSGEVKVDGLRELNNALRAVGKDAQSELRDAGKKIAETVADDARSNAYSLGGVAAKVAPSIRASAGVRSAGVGFGGAAFPFAGGAEFGSLRYKQFKPWRGNTSDAGYFVYPSIRSNSERITEDYAEAVDDLMRRHDLL